MESNRVLFSVIIPAFNHGEYLQDCLNSLLNQIFKDWEAIVIDDGSTDNTKELAYSFCERDSRIQYVFQENQGLSAARNAGMKQASGKYLLFLDSDDWLETTCLREFENAILNFPDYELYRCGYGYWDKINGNLFHQHLPNASGEIYPEVLEINLGPCHSILIRSELTDQLEGFDPSLKSCEDWDFWILAGKMGAKVYSISKRLVAYRYVANSMSRNPEIMYLSLTEVSKRAFDIDLRLPGIVRKKIIPSPELGVLCKKHFLPLLGTMIHQNRELEAITWYQNEKKKWDWSVSKHEWVQLSSYLNWKYFLNKDQIENLLFQTAPRLNLFLNSVGYSLNESKIITRSVFAPQIKKLHHLKYGKLVGTIINRIAF